MKTSNDLYVDDFEVNALDYFLERGFVLRPMREDSMLNANNNYIVSDQPLAIYDENGELIKEESNVTIAMVDTGHYSLFSDVMLQNLSLKEFLFDGTGMTGALCFIDEESYLSDPIIFRPDNYDF
ncbi:MAG: hypothetical protein Q4F54_05870 [Coriobacteriia bacterium]|nr:hypothetical protein [Coriobacteriia bacterium]